MQRGASERKPVCFTKAWTNESCGQVRFNGSQTKSFYAMPRGVRYWMDAANSSRCELNQELGRNHARLPVSHTHTMQHAWQPGLWFFYMRGCSDFEWDMGRTLLVRNRCHLAVELEQRAHRVGWARAISRVARKLVLAANISAWAPDFANSSAIGHVQGAIGMIAQPLESLVGGSMPGRVPKRGVPELAEALDACARGILPANRSVRDLAFQLLMLNTLDYTSGAMLMHELPGQIDTIQFANKCDTTNNNATDIANTDVCVQPVEIWDVRAIATRWSSSPRKQQPYSGPHGNKCSLAESFMYCMACSGSQSEHACRYRCSQPHRGRPSVFAPQGTRSFEVTYGQAMLPSVQRQVAALGPMGKADFWRFVWERVLRQLPRLPHAERHSNASRPQHTTTNASRSHHANASHHHHTHSNSSIHSSSRGPGRAATD